MSAEVGSRWYVVQTHPHAEAKAALHLGRQGFTTYLPRHLKQRRHARRIEKVTAPLFPRYLFVSIAFATQRWLSIDSTFGVTRLVREGDRPAPVPDHVIDALKRREDANLVARGKTRSRIQSNKSVGIFATFECFDDMVGNWRRAVALTDQPCDTES